MADLRTRQHDVERGEILRLLISWGRRGWMKTKTLLYALDDIRVPLSPDDLAYHLSYLGEAGYLELKRRRDEPMWRSDRRQKAGEQADDIIAVQLTNRGLLLYDGKIDADPGVRF